jgi:hypothetical protein
MLRNHDDRKMAVIVLVAQLHVVDLAVGWRVAIRVRDTFEQVVMVRTGAHVEIEASKRSARSRRGTGSGRGALRTGAAA